MTGVPGLAGRPVLVTGGTRGIGRAVSLALARTGACVVANYARNERAAQALAEAADREGLALTLLRADLASAKGMEAVRETVAGLAPGAVSLVHCAATGVHRPLEQLTPRHWDFTHALNVRAFFELVQVLRFALAPGSAIVAVSSAGATRVVPAYAAIGSSKAALESLARHMAVELAPSGVRVNVVSPGSVETEAWDAFPDKDRRLAEAKARTPGGCLVTAEQVAHVVAFLLSPLAEGLVGQTLVIDGGAGLVA